MLPGKLDILQMILDAGLMVQFVLLLLLFFSITTWAIIIIKFRYIRLAYRESEYFIDLFWESRDFAVADKEATELEDSPIARIFRTGYEELKRFETSGSETEGKQTFSVRKTTVIKNVERALRRSINTEITGLTQLVPFLATTGNTTPFIGLFGTVWGIMNSFHGIGLRGSANLAVVAPGISEALVATAAGLAVAIPAVIAFNYFMQKIRILESELQSFAADFLNIVERDILGEKE
jgi:biopolymer transport protein TolQ